MTRSRACLLTPCALAVALLAGCGGSEPAADSEAPPAVAAETPGPAGPATGAPADDPSDDGAASGGPPAVATLSSRGTPTGSGPAPSPAGAAGLHFELPAAWRQQPPSSSMRLAQAEIPGPGGLAELTVFFFGVGGGGGTEDNIERWIGQVEATGEPRRESFESHGLTVTWVDVSGTLTPTGMGMGPAEPQPGSRLFGAVVEGPGGPWFFKATGPEATLAAARDDFVALLRGLRPA